MRASRDGTQWVALQELPELRDLFATARPTQSVEQQQAERLRTQLRGLQNLSAHDIFGVKPHASLDELRLAYFRMAKRFTPDHMSPDTHPELKKVSAEIFEFLSKRMREAEALYMQGAQQARPAPPRLDMHGGAVAPAVAPVMAPVAPAMAPVAPVVAPVAPARAPVAPPVAAPPPRPPPVVQAAAAPMPARAPVAPAAAPTPVMRPQPAASPPLRTHTLPSQSPAPAPSVRKAATEPSYSAAEFVGLERRSDDRIHADVRVTVQNAGIFTDHRIINLSSGGLFIATDKPLRLGTQVELTLRFDDPARVMTLRSSVIWENSLEDGKNPRGYGLRLSHLRPEEKEFIQKFLVKAKPPKK
ncbi:TIGR02266 family protein [Pyxidicoccus parkwayensis]|uniref:TIGR02266 family protein n=1 Tax=Pyxidicoccus parkwayensis TaxID=2813578 RepID=UPI001F512048|nr:TIGR02266 family protein [Pyxidicoccus parkwaysis]